MVWFKCLKQAKQRQHKEEIVGLDVETYGQKNTFYCASLVGNGWQKTFFTKQDIIDFIRNTREKTIFVSTNLQFDFNAIFYGQKEASHFRPCMRGSHLVSMTTYTSKEGFTPKRKNSRSSHKLTFIDTLNYAQMGVEKLGESIGVKKMELPKDVIGNKERMDSMKDTIIAYNIRDAEISKKFMDFLYNILEGLGATVKTTIASTALSLYRNKYLDTHYFVHDTPDLLELFEAYYGGRTEAFMRGKIENLYYYDFNSLYPSVMTREYPDPNSHRVTHENTLDYITTYEGASLVTVVVPKTRYPLLPFRTKDKLIFPTGIFTNWQSHVELREALKQGVKITKVHKTHYYTKTCKPFQNFVTDLYGLRMKLKSEGNPAELVVKLVMNGLYGKWAQKFVDRENIYHKDNIPDGVMEDCDDIEELGDYIRTIKLQDRPAYFCFPIWSLYTTAYGRLKVHDALVKHNAVYCDTDSILTSKHLEESAQLGNLKLENTVERGLVVKPKFYAFNLHLLDEKKHIIKLKGVSKLKSDELEKLIIEGKINKQKFAKFKESLRRGLIPNEIIEVPKEISFEDTKRDWNNQKFSTDELQDSTPHELEMLSDGTSRIKKKVKGELLRTVVRKNELLSSLC